LSRQLSGKFQLFSRFLSGLLESCVNLDDLLSFLNSHLGLLLGNLGDSLKRALETLVLGGLGFLLRGQLSDSLHGFS